MNENLAFSLDRADELHRELIAEYQLALKSQSVTVRAKHLTHEICGQLRGVLDRTARLYWEQCVRQALSADDQAKAVIYFPVTPDRNGFDSSLGRWRWKSVKDQHQAIYDYLLNLQPFTDGSNKWLETLTDLANQGKHIDLLPQTRIDERRITVTGAGGGAVSWGSGVRFGSGVRVMGAPIDPITQRVVPTPGVTERVEVWVSFVIAGHDVNAAAFCEHGCTRVRQIVTDMVQKFGLS